MTVPRISVLVPTFNYARYLPETLDSILNQDFRDFELLVVDDHSEDDTADVCARYADRDSRVRFSAQPQRVGMVANWNDCLRRARGEYVKFVFADDKLRVPDALSRLLTAMEVNRSVSLAACAREIIDADSRPVTVRGYGPKSVVENGARVLAEWPRRLGNRIGEPTATLFRRADAARGFDPEFSQLVDLEMWFHLLQRGDFAYVAECLCSFRRHPSQETERNRARRADETEHVKLFERYARALLEAGGARSLFALAYRLRKLPPGPQRTELLRWVGERWRGPSWTYRLHYFWHKLTRPLDNLETHLAQRKLWRTRHRR